MTTFYALLFRLRPSILTQFLKQVLRIKRRQATTRVGLTLNVDPVSHFGLEVMSTGVYEPAMTNFINTLLRPGDVFIDAGANEGYFSALGSKRVGNGRVFSIEPQSRLIPVINANAELNNCTNISIHHLALSDSAGTLELHLSPDTNSGASSLFRSAKLLDNTEMVEAKTLDQFVSENHIEKVRFMKVDCEGAEKVIVEGALESLRTHRIEFIAVEFHMPILSEAQVWDLDARIRSFGYGLTEAGSGIWVYHLPGLAVALSPLGQMRDIAPLASRSAMHPAD
jgi:FkbM family methyltransferase